MSLKFQKFQQFLVLNVDRQKNNDMFNMILKTILDLYNPDTSKTCLHAIVGLFYESCHPFSMNIVNIHEYIETMSTTEDNQTIQLLRQMLDSNTFKNLIGCDTTPKG